MNRWKWVTSKILKGKRVPKEHLEELIDDKTVIRLINKKKEYYKKFILGLNQWIIY